MPYCYQTTVCVDIEGVCGCMFCLDCKEEALGCGYQHESDSEDEDLHNNGNVEGWL
jgi:hypothetical protein